MTNGTGPATETPELTQAPEVAPQPQRPQHYAIEFVIETPEGFHAKLVATELAPGKTISWLKETSRLLAEAGMKPVSMSPTSTVTVTAGPVAAGASTGSPSGEATWIVSPDGKPPRCSLHGPGEWREGEYKATHAKAGQHYEFWTCRIRDCRPKGSPTKAAA